jgi:hypothetical protein
MQSEPVIHLDPETAQAFLEKLPRHIREAFYARAAEIEYPIEAVLESARSSRYPQGVAASLDPETLSFMDCQPER